MARRSLEERVKTLETEVAQLKGQIEEGSRNARPWWEKIAGSFANDPMYEEAMRLGREWRESFGKKRMKSRK